MVRGIDGTLVALPEQGGMDYHKNAASCHSVNGYRAPKNHKSVEAPTVKPEGRNGMIWEVALLVVMQSIEVLRCWRSSRRSDS